MDIYRLMKLLSDPSRMKILFVIFTKPSYVLDIVEVTQLSQANVSKHLKKLRELGLVTNTEQGNKVQYSINGCYSSQCIIFVPLMEMYRTHPDGQNLIKRIEQLAN